MQSQSLGNANRGRDAVSLPISISSPSINGRVKYVFPSATPISPAQDFVLVTMPLQRIFVNVIIFSNVGIYVMHEVIIRFSRSAILLQMNPLASPIPFPTGFPFLKMVTTGRIGKYLKHGTMFRSEQPQFGQDCNPERHDIKEAF